MRTPVDPDAIRAAREAVGLTQHQLAHRIGVAGGERISRWELGTSTPRLDMLATLARVLQVDIEVLLAPGTDLSGLRGLRARRGLTVREAAELCHVSLATYLRWEKGIQVTGPPSSSVAVLARVLEVPRATIVGALRTGRG